MMVMPACSWAEKKIDKASGVEYERIIEYDGLQLMDDYIEITGPGNQKDPNTINIPENIEGRPVRVIAKNAFKDDLRLIYLTINPSGSDDFFIEESAFEGCKNLRSITINSDPIYAFIRKYAFRNTGITILHLPSFVSSNWHFEDDVFEGSDLTKVWVESIYQYPNIGNNTFGDKIKDITCPYLQSARLKENWSGYADYIREDYQLLDEDRGFLASNGMTEGPYCPHQLVLRRKNLTPGQYFTTYLPFDMGRTYKDIYKDIELIATPTGQIIHNTENDTYLVVMKKCTDDDYIKAGTPLLLKLKDNVKYIGFTNDNNVEPFKVQPTDPTKMTVLDWDGKSGFMTENNSIDIQFTGNYDPVTNGSKDIWSFNGDGSFSKLSGTLNAFRMYLTIDAATSANVNRISIVDFGTTGIEGTTVKKPSKVSSAIYSLDGRLVSKDGSTAGLAKGLYIQGGKKVIVR
ncbi:MAG: leucine-rich repeat domain-containing protein [Prevotella sp.]|nr:leucine-rich repeat domain-containing protein [Prevotella sp.]MDD7047167.1 leucine-rich repeat protein [Prevotella sp.]MDY5546789.1 leucine-rich repeat protein [Prevotella sp.]